MKPLITICGSMTFFPEMKNLAEELEGMGYLVLLPSEDRDHNGTFSSPGAISPSAKRTLMNAHLEKILKADAVLIANFEKRGTSGYIGSNTLVEIAFAYASGKPVYVLNPIGEQACKEEALGLQSSNLDTRLSEIEMYLQVRS